MCYNEAESFLCFIIFLNLIMYMEKGIDDMEKSDLLERIREEFSSYSKGQKAIATYILENYDKAAFMTAGVLGETVGVSESTVVRFAYALGYKGYP